jgi:hypothetical protein
MTESVMIESNMKQLTLEVIEPVKVYMLGLPLTVRDDALSMSMSHLHLAVSSVVSDVGWRVHGEGWHNGEGLPQDWQSL